MADSEYDLEPVEESKPKPPAPPGGYLPRLSYKPPEPDPDAPEAEETAEAGQPAKSPKKKPQAAPPLQKVRPRAEPNAESSNRVLKEDTPEFDTYEARKRMRMVVGGIAGLCFLFAGFTIIRNLLPEPEPTFEDVPSEPGFQVPHGPPPGQQAKVNEEKAKALLEEARQYARKGKVEPAVARLELLKKTFQDTTTAHEAEAALARLADGFPMFPDGPIVQASAVESPAQTTVSAQAAQAPAVEGQAVAQVEPPPMVPEVVADNSVSAAPRKLLPDGYHARPGAGLHESGWPREIACDRDHSTMVLVPGGTYREGNDRGALAERPEHMVTLSTFYIDRHEVTNRQMQAFREATGAGPADATEAPELPAVNVSLSDARAYAEWAGKAIPSEAQWEAAARSLDGRLYPWGRGPANWSQPREPRQIDPVMTYPSDLSPSGAFDMAGNVWEWTNDIFSTSYYDEIKKTPAVDPAGPDRSHSRIVEYTVKGGSNDWDVPWRSGMRPEAKLPYLGFRCVLKVDQAPAPAIPSRRLRISSRGKRRFRSPGHPCRFRAIPIRVAQGKRFHVAGAEGPGPGAGEAFGPSLSRQSVCNPKEDRSNAQERECAAPIPVGEHENSRLLDNGDGRSRWQRLGGSPIFPGLPHRQEYGDHDT